MNDEMNRMLELVRRLKETSYAYYVLDNPVISDMQWDRLYDELKKLEAETGVVLEDSPTRKVGGDPLKGFEEHRHITRLWSMDKVQSMEELDAWIRPGCHRGWILAACSGTRLSHRDVIAMCSVARSRHLQATAQ